ncbi:zinc-binding dehydrogenase [Streptomyces sp. SID12501]|uniref:2-deoxy-scyllo-inosamine dehydrogenase n=1 Tax=Streptomyces sp. SID12501 TaxID=2706042 RepID=A0A6B3C7S7_9ACTN|nr:alcohol dehydrogenase catalytic domain-containing protein [Streptomyces sp. SID12501]NEC92160.1 alcohol dehydrogenase catalytic domain-containing protein [Streptomyces sp. SID12501]
MRAVIKAGPGPGCQFVTDRPEPALRPGEVRLEVAAASVCGSDAAFFDHGGAAGDIQMTFPRTMGHECAGTVVEVGPHSYGPALGTRVAMETHLHCGECWFCRRGDGHNCERIDLLGVAVDGAFAERVVVPARSCFVLPDEIGSKTAALLESAGSAMHGVLRSGMDLAGASVLISGAGPVGLVAAQIVEALGARRVVVVEPNAHRRRLAETLGAQAIAPDVDAIAAADSTTRVRGGFDLALECSGAVPAMQAALSAVRREATVVAVGLLKVDLSIDATETLITRGITLRGSWGRSIWETWDKLSALVVSKKVDLEGLITHRLPISALPHALELMRGDAGKVLLDPSLPDGVGRA